jgi:hypothetical protein
MRVIIPAAKIVPEELQKLGKLPGIIYPINQKITFDYLYEQYKDVMTSMDIICYEKVDEVKKKLNKYLGNKVNIKVLPELKDLGHTIYYALEETDETVLINFSDTIVENGMEKLGGDSFYCYEGYVSDTWTYFDEDNGVITNVYDKTSSNPDVKKKLFAGVFYINHPQKLKNCLEDAFHIKNPRMGTFYYALMEYSKSYPIQAVMTDKWFDIGHADTYYNSKLEVKAREFNHIEIDRERGILKKYSDDRDKFIREIKWYLKLPSDLEYVRPRIFDYSTSYESPYVSMEYYAYHTLHELFLYGDLTHQQWMDVFKRIRYILDDFKRYTVTDGKIIPSLEDMYLTKTLQRLKQIENDKRFKVFFTQNINVNGRKYISLEGIRTTLNKLIPSMLYDVGSFRIIHGDLCFANIMIDGNFSFVKVIDPRGRFGLYDIYGDARYEIAKLLHSIDGKYDFIIKDLFELDYNLEDAFIKYRILDSGREYDIYKIFTDVFGDEIGTDLIKIELIEALLFISMIPLHKESLEHQLVMLGTGIELLNRVVDITV